MADDTTPENPLKPEPTPVPPRPAYGEYAPGMEPGGAGTQTPEKPTTTPVFSAAPPSAEDQFTSAKPLGAFASNSWPRPVASFTKYVDAQAAVDLLSDKGFPVERVSIVGHDVRTVENVVGRVTKASAAARGAAGGAWFGLLLGLLFGFFVANGSFIGIALTALGLGAIWGALFGFVGHAATRGQRDFASTQSIEAGRYEVLVQSEFSAKAQEILAAGR